MATRTETRFGTCPDHGAVEGIRELPRPSFPFIIYGIRLFLARRKPFRCPSCTQPLS